MELKSSLLLLCDFKGGRVLKRGTKLKRSKRMYFEAEDSYIITDLAIVFIGFAMFLYGGLSYGGNLSARYAIAASISSFLFVLAECILATEKITGRIMILHGLIFGGGIISLILIPATLEALPNLIKHIGPTADMLTFFSLGLVLLLFGTKSMDMKLKARQEVKKEEENRTAEIERLHQHIRKLQEENRSYKGERKDI